MNASGGGRAVKAARRGAKIPSGLAPPISELLKDIYEFPYNCVSVSDPATTSNICRRATSRRHTHSNSLSRSVRPSGVASSMPATLIDTKHFPKARGCRRPRRALTHRPLKNSGHFKGQNNRPRSATDVVGEDSVQGLKECVGRGRCPRRILAGGQLSNSTKLQRSALVARSVGAFALGIPFARCSCSLQHRHPNRPRDALTRVGRYFRGWFDPPSSCPLHHEDRAPALTESERS